MNCYTVLINKKNKLKLNLGFQKGYLIIKINLEAITCCLIKVFVSAWIVAKEDNSVSFRITHSINSLRDSKRAFQCSALLSRRFL